MLTSASEFSELAGHTERLVDLFEACNDLSNDSVPQLSKKALHRLPAELQARAEFHKGGGDLGACNANEVLEVSKIPIISPCGEVLSSPISFTVQRGESLFITGPNGSGKSGLLRILRGLWPVIDGRIALPKESFFLPQRPFMPNGSLRSLLTYPQIKGPRCIGCAVIPLSFFW